MRLHRWVVALGFATGFGVAPLGAQGTPPAFGCPSAPHRQFDFWIGDWNVTTGGKAAGTNHVTLEEDGCVIHEHWRGSRGGTGQSFTFYDAALGKWHQVWVDNQGNSLHLVGSYADNTLILEGTAPGPGQAPQQQRLTFFRNADGSVRQLWESSADGGKAWAVQFDGLYLRK